MWPRLPLNFTVQLFLIIFLTTSNLFVDSQHVRDDIAVESETEDLIPQGSSTLAFVFDVTGSMYDDLVQVIEGAAKILAITLSKRERPLYNYALVPFHDPEIGPVTITTDPKEFQKNLRDLYVMGGGDCPEMSLSAIETALTISLPSSFIYVFTDARAKDFDLTENVLKLIQEKQSQIVFVMTGDCGNRSHVGFQAYEDIAATSSGQLFMLNKSDVDEVLTFVSLSIQARKVHLLAVNNEESGSKVFVLPVDPALREFVVSVSGDNPSISLIDPMGQEITKENGLVELLGIDNVYIVTVKEPKPGSWKLTASSQSTNQLRVTGLSTLDFVPGYSKKPVFRLEDALHRPIDGIPTYMIINATGLEPPGVFIKLELLNLQGQTIREFPLQLNVSNPSIYTIPMFLPPSEFFHLRVSGIDKQNYLFHRLSSTAVSPLKPVAPRVKTTTKTPGYYGDTATLTCNVDSLIPYTVLWEKDSSPLGKPLYYADSGEAKWEISNVNTYSEGFYTCTAKSTAGEGQATTFLDVTEPPPSIDIPLNVSVLPGRNAVLTCTAYSTVQFNMTWTKPDSFVVLSRHPRVKFLPNGSLKIRKVNQADGGRYQCIASNEGGSSVKDVFLAIQEMPKVSINRRHVTFISGDNITISCSSRGLPAPSVYWTKDDLKLTNGPKITVSKDGVLNIFNASTSESGLYACIASNTAGTDKKSLHVTYIEAARIRLLRRKVLVKYGETAKLNCPAKGIPPPIITWFKKGFPVLSSGFTEIQPNGDLLIVGTKEMDSEEYTCIATNSAGSDSDVITLDVGSEPFILQPSYDIGVDIGMNMSLPCVSYGFPRPQTFWYKKDDSLETNKRAKIGEDGTLFIRDLQVEDEGTYVCVVENQFGKEEVSAYLRITGIVPPVIAFSNPEINVIKGSHTTITCQILIGNPPPTIRWLKDGKPINTDVHDSLTITDEGSLFISKAKISDAGKYICVASNIAGNSSFTSTVKVQVEQR